jgi:hypothetical protein
MDELVLTLSAMRQSIHQIKKSFDDPEDCAGFLDPSDPAQIRRSDLHDLLSLIQLIRDNQLFPTPVHDGHDTPSTGQLFTGHCEHRYAEHKKGLEYIFTDIFPYWDSDSFQQKIVPIAKIPKNTIYRWKNAWELNPSWRPWDTKYNHGNHHRLFNTKEETEIAHVIVSQYLDEGHLFTSATFAAVAVEKWQELGRDPDQFKCSHHFIQDFKERNHFSSRRCHVKRRDRHGEEQSLDEWISKIQYLIEAHRNSSSLDLVVNCDETAWRLIPSGLLTWAPVGADGVTIRLNGNEKDNVTVLASVAASGNKLPLFAIAKGKTQRSEMSQLGSDETLIRDHSESGWSTIETFKHYLNWLHDYYAIDTRFAISEDQPIHLILDCYSVHRSEQIKQYAADRCIKLWFIPAGHTDALQPLDRAVFGAIKSIFRRRFEECQRNSWEKRVTKTKAIAILQEIWNNLSVDSIRLGWAIYEPDFGPDVSDDIEWEE